MPVRCSPRPQLSGRRGPHDPLRGTPTAAESALSARAPIFGVGADARGVEPVPGAALRALVAQARRRPVLPNLQQRGPADRRTSGGGRGEGSPWPSRARRGDGGIPDAPALPVRPAAPRWARRTSIPDGPTDPPGPAVPAARLLGATQ